MLFIYSDHGQAKVTTDAPVVVKKGKQDNFGFGGFDQDHYAECYPGYVVN